jgi:hypothetical protein
MSSGVVSPADRALWAPRSSPRPRNLLEALERVLEHGERFNLYYERGEDAELLKQVRAAIAKAKGQE